MPVIGSHVPEFTVQAFHEGTFKEISSQDLRGHWSVLFFYPADFTFVCPTELADLADAYAELQEMGVEVYSISTDTHFVHAAWHQASETIQRITFPMLADPTAQLARAFDVYDESAGVAHRGTFVADPDGRITVAELHDEGIGRNAAELVRKIKAAQYVAANPGQACPARWREGDATLTPGIDLVGKI